MTSGADTLNIYETDEFDAPSGNDILSVLNNYVGPGDTVYLEPGGIFRWRYRIDTQMGSGTASNRITFTSNPNNRAIFDFGIYENWDSADDMNYVYDYHGMDEWPGGMWGGGMTFPVIVVQKASTPILKDAGVKLRDEDGGYFSADSIESITKLCSWAIDAGAHVFNAISVEDVLLDKGRRVNGFVINY